MSHQVIITFDVDETQVAENAAKEAGRQIAQAVLKEVFGDTYLGSYSAKRNATQFLEAVMEEVLKDNKEEILEKAIKEVVGSLTRSKIVRERMQEALDGKAGSMPKSDE